MEILQKTFFQNDAVIVAQQLLGAIIEIKDTDGCKYRWRIIETEAYKEDEDGPSICHHSEKHKSCGKIFAEGNNGLIITCGQENSADNVLIRGLITIFYSQPYKAMKATTDFNVNMKEPIDLTIHDSIITIYKHCSSKEIIVDYRVGLKEKSDKKWNFKLFDIKSEDKIDMTIIKELNE